MIKWFKYVVAIVGYLPTVVRNEPVGFDRGDGTEYYEQWNRKALWALRPRYYGLTKQLDCGCTRRLGRVILINSECVKHLGFDWRAELERYND